MTGWPWGKVRGHRWQEENWSKLEPSQSRARWSYSVRPTEWWKATSNFPWMQWPWTPWTGSERITKRTCWHRMPRHLPRCMLLGAWQGWTSSRLLLQGGDPSQGQRTQHGCCLTNTWASYASCWSTLSAWLGGYKILQVYVHSLEGPSYLKMWKNGFASTKWSSEPKILTWTKTGIERPVESGKLCRLRGEWDWRDLHDWGRASRTSRWSRTSRRRTNRASIPDEDVLDEHEVAEILNAMVQQKCKTFT